MTINNTATISLRAIAVLLCIAISFVSGCGGSPDEEQRAGAAASQATLRNLKRELQKTRDMLNAYDQGLKKLRANAPYCGGRQMTAEYAPETLEKIESLKSKAKDLELQIQAIETSPLEQDQGQL
ncbi:hypothetical protein M2447_001464 [Ereboglobus sp. PH5-10]|uniref:hypothetical protein n=1 Tax=Ereboglobus sp. PH5-10 TaxID=2940629 RepID=UPI002404EE41|nr:hypothetical protein [Ereboglobus sp. PH5-10]MDF9827371.1 hypothetical protein [Ereboglobus sp. PH5-10]